MPQGTDERRPPEHEREPDDSHGGARPLAGKYRLGRLLGEGGMGAVYEAEHLGLGSRVAVKLLNPFFANSQTALARFRREARAAAAVRHPNLVTATDIDVDEDGVPFIVMELLEGESLSAVLRRQRHLEPPVAAAIGMQVLEGLVAAHERKLIHRDLKPGNIFLAAERPGVCRVKILDFGVSKFADDAQEVTATGAVIGTPRFMAPEQARGEADLDARADIYSLGLVLYLLTTGKVPFTGASRDEVLEQVQGGVITAPRKLRPELPEALEAVILRATAARREDRYPDAASMLADLRQAMPEVPTEIQLSLGAAGSGGGGGASGLPIGAVSISVAGTAAPHTATLGSRRTPTAPISGESDAAPATAADDTPATAAASPGSRGGRAAAGSSPGEGGELVSPGEADTVPRPGAGDVPVPVALAAPTIGGPAARPAARPSSPPAAVERRRRRLVVALLVVAALAAAAGAGPAYRSLRGGGDGATAKVPPEKPLRFGINRYASKTAVEAGHQPFVEYLERRVGRRVELVMSEDYEDLGERLIAGDLDLAALSAWTYVRAKRASPDIRIVAMPVTSGGPKYQGYILSRANSDVRTLADLAGRVFCYVSPNSTSGYLYPRALLKQAGMDPDRSFSATRFTGDHQAAMQALASGACDGAAVYAAAYFGADGHGMRPDAFRILGQTEEMPYDAYCVAGGMAPALAARISEALIALPPGSELAKQIFAGHTQILGFKPAVDADFDRVRQVERLVAPAVPATP